MTVEDPLGSWDLKRVLWTLTQGMKGLFLGYIMVTPDIREKGLYAGPSLKAVKAWGQATDGRATASINQTSEKEILFWSSSHMVCNDRGQEVRGERLRWLCNLRVSDLGHLFISTFSWCMLLPCKGLWLSGWVLKREERMRNENKTTTSSKRWEWVEWCETKAASPR